MIELYQFPFSHFCEKARWALDYKGLSFTERNLLPGLHVSPAKRIAPRSSLPILVDGSTVVQDSVAIISHLDRAYSNDPLTPADPALAQQAVQFEQWLGDEVGATVRRWFYFHTLPDRGRTLDFILQDARGWQPLAFRLMFPGIRAAMMRAMDVQPQSAQESLQRLEAALSGLDESLRRQPFLVGDGFTRADLAACALLAPLVGIGLSEDDMARRFAAPVLAWRERYRQGRVFEWVRAVYRNHRRRPAARGPLRVRPAC